MNSIKFNQTNEPNAAKLIESLRYLGYDNYVAIADIVDNSLDAEADLIKIRVWTEKGQFHVMVGDNGIGMDLETLDQALRLGSDTTKNPTSDLGRFGMGLCTAGLSIARQTRVITKRSNVYLTSVVDIDEVIKTNTFCKYLGESSADDKKLIDEEFPDSASATIVIFDKCDGIRNQNVTIFSNTLRKHLGRIHRYFLMANRQITVNGEDVKVVDPLELNDPQTTLFSDEEYPITVKVDGQERQERIRIKIALVPEDTTSGEREIATNITYQGFYILRNNREIKMAQTLDAFTKHNDFNRMRGEVFLTGDLDKIVGIDFTKREMVFDQSLKDQLLVHLKAQCTTIKRQESGRTKAKESDEIVDLHRQAEKYIDQKAKLLVTPKTVIEKRQPRSEDEGRQIIPVPKGQSLRKNLADTQKADASRCKFEYVSFGSHGQIYECDLVGRVVVIRWNIDHPFYQRFILDQRSDGRLVTAVDYLIYSMASAELKTLSDETRDLFNNFKAIVSANVNTLLA